MPLELSDRAGVRRVTSVNCMGGSERRQVIHSRVTALYKTDAAMSRTPTSQHSAHTHRQQEPDALSSIPVCRDA